MNHRTLALVLASAALVATGCDNTDPNKGVAPPQRDLAFVRYVNAVPDTNSLDFRYIDRIDDSQPFIGVQFRSFTPYQGTPAGNRQIRVFTNPAAFPLGQSLAVSQQVVEERTVSLVAGTYYTIVHAGRAQGDQDSLIVIQDNIPTPPAGQLAFRAIHAVPASIVGNVNVLVNIDGVAALAAPASASFSALAPFTASAYANVPVRPATPATSTYQFGVEAAAAPGTAVASASIAGVLLTGLTNQVSTVAPSASVRAAGSVITGIVFPPSVAPVTGNTATSDRPSFTTPGFRFLPDRNP